MRGGAAVKNCCFCKNMNFFGKRKWFSRHFLQNCKFFGRFTRGKKQYFAEISLKWFNFCIFSENKKGIFVSTPTIMSSFLEFPLFGWQVEALLV
jgi:hypothetical protein